MLCAVAVTDLVCHILTFMYSYIHLIFLSLLLDILDSCFYIYFYILAILKLDSDVTYMYTYISFLKNY